MRPLEDAGRSHAALELGRNARAVVSVKQLLAIQPLEACEPEFAGPKLRRVLGWPGLVGIGLGTMLGGIFTTVGAGAATAGPAVIGAFVLSGLACVFVALCYAEFASMVPVAGSAYTYAYATLGEFVAWIIGWDLILEYGISAAPVAASWSGYMQALLAGAGIHLPAWAQTAHLSIVHGRLDLAGTQVDVLAVGIILGISALLAIGIKESSSVNNGLVVAQILASSSSSSRACYSCIPSTSFRFRRWECTAS